MECLIHTDTLRPLKSCMCVCLRLWARLLDEEVVHAAVVVGGGQDVQCIVLPLGGLQIDAADFQAAPPLHLWGRLLVLLTVLDGPGRGCLQIWTVRRRRALCRSRVVDTDIFRTTNKEMIKSPRHIFFSSTVFLSSFDHAGLLLP